MAGFGLLVGFSNGVSLAKKKDEKAFTQGLMMLNNQNKPAPEAGVRLAMRALGYGSLWAFAGVGLVCSSVWFIVGAKDVSEPRNVHTIVFYAVVLIQFVFCPPKLKDFRLRMGQMLPRVPRNEPQGRTEFESFRDLFNYLSEESETKKKKKQETSTSELSQQSSMEAPAD